MNKRNRMLLIITCILAGVCGGLFFFLHMPSRQYRQKLSIGLRFLNTGNYSGAEAAFQDAIAISPKQKDAYEGIVTLYLMQADELEETDPEQAEQYYEQADSYAQQAKEAGAGTIHLSDYGTYTPAAVEAGGSGETESEAVSQAEQTNVAKTDYLTPGIAAIMDAKTRYESKNGENSVNSVSDNTSSLQYTLYDFTGDGIRDMAITINPNGQGGARYFYRFDNKKAELVREDTDVIHLGLTLGYKNGFACLDGGEMAYTTFVYSWNGSELTQTPLSSGSVTGSTDGGSTLLWQLESDLHEIDSGSEYFDRTLYAELNWRKETDKSLLEEASTERTDFDYENIYQSSVSDAVEKLRSKYMEGGRGYPTDDTMYFGASYTLSDVNHDGILDLIVDGFHDKHGAALYVYSYDGSSVHDLGSLEKDTSGFDFASCPGGFAWVNCYKGYYDFTRQTCTVSSMTQADHQEGSGDRDDTYTLDDTGLENLIRPIGWFDYKDMSLLKKPYCPYGAA